MPTSKSLALVRVKPRVAYPTCLARTHLTAQTALLSQELWRCCRKAALPRMLVVDWMKTGVLLATLLRVCAKHFQRARPAEHVWRHAEHSGSGTHPRWPTEHNLCACVCACQDMLVGLPACCGHAYACRVDQNHVYIWCIYGAYTVFWQGYHQIYGHSRCWPTL
jgi:hypothetical protein